jgi:hypothetical protein
MIWYATKSDYKKYVLKVSQLGCSGWDPAILMATSVPQIVTPQSVM